LPQPPVRYRDTSSPGLATGNMRSIKAWNREKTAVLAPIPSASEMTAAAVKPGLRRSPAQGVANVLGGDFEPRNAAAVAIGLLGLCDTSEGTTRGRPRRRRVHALPTELLFLHGEMGGDLLAQLAVQTAAAEECQKRCKMVRIARSYSAARRKRSMMATVRAQSSDSCVTWRRPARVSS